LDFDPEALRKRYREERDKRLRPNGSTQYVEHVGQFAHYSADPYVEPGFTRDALTDEVEVAVLGAGLTGLMAGARLRQAGVESIRIIDKAGDFGGTWYWNRYPGIACDVECTSICPFWKRPGYIPREKYSKGEGNPRALPSDW